MDIKTAIEILEDVARDHGELMLDTLIYMRDNLDDFSDREVVAFRVFMREGARMFARV